MCKALMLAGANVNAMSVPGRTAGELGYTALYGAAQSGHTDVCNDLLAAGANVNAVSDMHYTALHHAAQYGHTDTCAALVAAGANANAMSANGITPPSMQPSATIVVCVMFCWQQGPTPTQ